MSSLAPKLLRFDLQKLCKEYAAATSGHDAPSGQEMANLPRMARAFRVENGDLVGRTPREFNTEFGNSLGGIHHPLPRGQRNPGSGRTNPDS